MIQTDTRNEVDPMSPLDMLIMLFFILVTIQAARMSISYWQDKDDNEK